MNSTQGRIMQVILTYLDPVKGPKIIATQPKLSDVTVMESILAQIFQMGMRPTNFDDIIPIEEGNFANYLFCLPSAWNSAGCEKVMISVTLDEHENPRIFKSVFNRSIDRMKGVPNLFKAFYINANKPDPQIPSIFAQLEGLLKTLLEDLNKLVKKQLGLAEIIFLGIGAVGKTCIINRLITGQFDNRIRPTLSTQILQMVFEQIDFKVYDVGGQVNLRQFWGDALKKPQAIVFVIDSSHTPEQHNDSVKEFNRMMQFYFNEMGVNKNVPVLLLGNKCDKNPEYNEDQILKQYNPDKFQLNYDVAMVSALTGAGLLEAFKWLSQQIKVTRV
jgi:small GTP-binding protein